MKDAIREELAARFLLFVAGVGVLVILSLTGCATVKTCATPVSAQAVNDGAIVLACAAQGQSLASCEQQQFVTEAGQLTSDLLVCGELAVAAAAQGTHAAAKPDAGP